MIRSIRRAGMPATRGRPLLQGLPRRNSAAENTSALPSAHHCAVTVKRNLNAQTDGSHIIIMRPNVSPR